MSEHLSKTWKTIIQDENHHIIVKVINDKIVASCVCVVIPNLTRNVRPYAFIENVVTHKDYRGRGYATECLDYAKKIAEKKDLTVTLHHYMNFDGVKNFKAYIINTDKIVESVDEYFDEYAKIISK